MKTTTKNVIYKKKSLDNGDVSKHIISNLGSKTMSALKKDKEKDDFKNDLKKVKNNQKKLINNLKKTPFEKKFPKLPYNIDDNSELMALLLKDPDKMTSEEKNYIESFNDEEFKRFMEFLNNKKKEQKWQGNGYGSGKYLENFIHIHSNDRLTRNERILTLKGYLKMSHNNNKAKSINKKDLAESTKVEVFMRTENSIFKHEDLNSDQGGAPVDSIMQNTISTKEIIKEIEKFKNLLTEVKTDINLKKHEGEKNLIFQDIENKANIMKKDFEKVKNIKNDLKSDLEMLLEKYKQSVEDSKESCLNKDILLEKIRNYIKLTNLTPLEFVKIIDNNAFSTNIVNLHQAEKSIIKLKILTEVEANLFFNNLKKFYPSQLALDKFVNFIEIDDEYTPVFPEEDTAFIEEEGKIFEEELNNKDEGIIQQSIEDSRKHSNEEEDEAYRKMVLKKRKISSIENLMVKKSTKLIQRIFRGYLIRKAYKIKKTRQIILVKRIQKQIRKLLIITKEIKTRNAFKIYYFLDKQSQMYKYRRELNISSKALLKNWETSRNFSANFIQKFWRAYRVSKLKTYNGKFISQSLLKSKTCVVCKKYRVTKLCLKCVDNHYCESCFEKLHSHGIKRNHEYSIIFNEFLQKETRINKISSKKVFNNLKDEAEELNVIFKDCDFNILEHIKMWDNEKEGIISHQRLKEAFSFKFFQFGVNICDKVLNLSYRFSKNKKEETRSNEIMIDYVEMCRILFNLK